jgi:hypothetical protein
VICVLSESVRTKGESEPLQHSVFLVGYNIMVLFFVLREQQTCYYFVACMRI